MNQLIIDMELCIGCDICMDLCVVKAISKTDGVYRVNAEICNYCKACVQMCPVQAISESEQDD